MYLRGDRRLKELETGVIHLAGGVLRQLQMATDALRDPAGAASDDVAAHDAGIDSEQLRLETLSLEIVALDEPHGSQARAVLAYVRINDELERIGDLAVHVANQAAAAAEHGRGPAVPVDLLAMADRAAAMLDRATRAIGDRDADEARTVRAMDEALDHGLHEATRDIAAAIERHPHQAGALLDTLNAARVIERIGDHAVIIAEQVMFIATGRVEHARHRPTAA